MEEHGMLLGKHLKITAVMIYITSFLMLEIMVCHKQEKGFTVLVSRRKLYLNTLFQ